MRAERSKAPSPKCSAGRFRRRRRSSPHGAAGAAARRLRVCAEAIVAFLMLKSISFRVNSCAGDVTDDAHRRGSRLRTVVDRAMTQPRQITGAC
jgi:hypothetical protein